MPRNIDVAKTARELASMPVGTQEERNRVDRALKVAVAEMVAETTVKHKEKPISKE